MEIKGDKTNNNTSGSKYDNISVADRFPIGDMYISNVNLDIAVQRLNECILNHCYGYVCVSNARSVYDANHNEDYCRIQNMSLLTLPDGRPLSWIAHNLGQRNVGQVAGNDIFHAMLSESEKRGYTHYFYGSSPSTIDLMLSRVGVEYPNAKVIGAVSPPFQSIENYDIESLAEEINAVSPDFLWIGLGAPKQERLMALLQPKLKKTICLGIGLVFEYYAGSVRRAPKWARRIGMEWLVRDLQQRSRKRTPAFRYVFVWTIGKLLRSFFTRKMQ